MIIKLHNRVVFRHIFSKNMKVSSILVISVIIKLQRDVVFRNIFSLNMKVSSIFVINQCDYQATTQGSLQAHIAAKHSDRILKCDHCDYQTKWRQDFYKHKRTTHAITVQFL